MCDPRIHAGTSGHRWRGYNQAVKPSLPKALLQTSCCLIFVAVAVLRCPLAGGDELTRLDGDALKVVVTAEEQALGREFIRLARTRLRLIEDPLLVNSVDRIGARLGQGLNVEPGVIGFHLVDNPAINGFAGPGGQIVLFTGLIATAETEAEFASVIAHELAQAPLTANDRTCSQAADTCDGWPDRWNSSWGSGRCGHYGGDQCRSPVGSVELYPHI